LIRPEGFDIPFDAEKIHGISTELATEMGENLEDVLHLFKEALGKANFVVGQNISFDKNVMGSEFHRLSMENNLQTMDVLDTCTEVSARTIAFIEFYKNGDPGRIKKDRYDKPILKDGKEEIESMYFKDFPLNDDLLSVRKIGNVWSDVPADQREEVISAMRKHKFPTLSELHQALFDQPFAEAHNATADVEATTRCFFELIRNEV